MTSSTVDIRTQLTPEEKAQAISALKTVHGFTQKRAKYTHEHDFIGIIPSIHTVTDIYIEHLYDCGNYAAGYFMEQHKYELAKSLEVLFFDLDIDGPMGLMCWTNSSEMRKVFGKY